MRTTVPADRELAKAKENDRTHADGWKSTLPKATNRGGGSSEGARREVGRGTHGPLLDTVACSTMGAPSPGFVWCSACVEARSFASATASSPLVPSRSS